MSPTAVLLMLFSGLSFLPACSPLHYVLVEKSYTWSEAQSYCREKYIDLASVHNQEDLTQLKQLTDESPGVWIGLRPDPESWRWSLEDPDYYGEGEAEFRNWALGEPSGGQQFWRACVVIEPNGKWNDAPCSNESPFLCKDTSGSILYIPSSFNRDQAQSFCRMFYTDLASVRSQTENDQLNYPSRAWIGLFRDGWKWTDDSPLSFSNWAPSSPHSDPQHSCGASVSGQWVNDRCDNKKPFVCSAVPTVQPVTQVQPVPPAFTETRRVKVVLHRSDSSVDMEELQEGILEEFNRKVKELGLSGNVKLRWVKQSDGKIFHKQEEEEEEEKKTCPGLLET